LAYLIGHYPAVTHTFILREVLALRNLGLHLETLSVNQPEWGQDGATQAELHETARTFYVKAHGPFRIACDHIHCLIASPRRYLSGLQSALRLGGLDLKASLRHLLYFAEAVVVGQWMRRNAIPHLHVHFAIATATVAVLVKAIYRIPYSITVHGPEEFYNLDFHHVPEKIEQASFICCIGHFCRSQLMTVVPPRHWEKLEICPLGVDPDAFQPAHVDTGVFHIVCVGRLVPRKGQAILLEAVARLAGLGYPVHLDLLGDGPDRPALQDAADRLNIRAHVSFHGWVNQDHIHAFLKHADLFVLPSFAEGIPVSLMEAMAMEIPCISTYIAGIPELIQSGEDGVLVPASDAQALTAAMQTLLDDPALRLRIARAGRRKVIEKYNLGLNTARLASIWRSRLEAERNARNGTATAPAAAAPAPIGNSPNTTR
jgi:glycosyltransferase involved in cell wall biosynthesis